MFRALVALAVLLAACAGSASDPTVATTQTPPDSSTTFVAPDPPPPISDVIVSVSDGHLTDEEGRSLYAFLLDVERTSSCEGPCAERWPPFLGRPVAGEGVDADLLGIAERPNGAIQVTYAGRPLYRFVDDVEPGDTNGHGFNDVWFLVGVDGEMID